MPSLSAHDARPFDREDFPRQAGSSPSCQTLDRTNLRRSLARSECQPYRFQDHPRRCPTPCRNLPRNSPYGFSLGRAPVRGEFGSVACYIGLGEGATREPTGNCHNPCSGRAQPQVHVAHRAQTGSRTGRVGLQYGSVWILDALQGCYKEP